MLILVFVFKQLQLIERNGYMLYVHHYYINYYLQKLSLHNFSALLAFNIFYLYQEILINSCIIWMFNILNQQIRGMSKSINAKRDQMRDQIRKRQRQSFFLSQRIKMLQNYQHSVSITTLINNFRSRSHLIETFQQATRIINGSNYYADTMKMIEQGLIFLMISFLKEKKYLKETLEIISFLVQKFTPQKHTIDIYQRLYSLGIFQLIIDHIKVRELSSLSVFILCKFTQAKEDYCETLIVSKMYVHLINQFYQRVLHSHNPEQQNIAEKYFTYTLTIMQNLLTMEDTASDLQTQRLQIFNFNVSVISRSIFIRPALGIFYEGVKAIGKRIGENHIQLINSLIEDVTIDSSYLQNLLATVYIMTPHRSINYYACFQAAIKVPKMYKIISYIFQRMLKSPNDIELIPTRQQFWEKLLIGSNDEDTFKRLLAISRELSLDKDFMWRVLESSLQSPSLGIQKQSIGLIYHKITNTENAKQSLFSLFKYNIVKQLEMLSKSKNQVIKQKASQLFDYINGPLTQMSQLIQ